MGIFLCRHWCLQERKYKNSSVVVLTTELKGWKFIIYLITFKTALKPHKILYYVQLFWTSGSVSSDSANKANVNFGSYLPVYNLMDSASEKLLIHNFPTHLLNKTVKCAIDSRIWLLRFWNLCFQNLSDKNFGIIRKIFFLEKLEHAEVWGLSLEHSYLYAL